MGSVLQSKSTLEIQSQIHSQNTVQCRRRLVSYGVFDREFDLLSRVDLSFTQARVTERHAPYQVRRQPQESASLQWPARVALPAPETSAKKYEIMRANPPLRVKVKFTVQNTVCNGLVHPNTAFLTVTLTLMLTSGVCS